jgi:integrase
LANVRLRPRIGHAQDFDAALVPILRPIRRTKPEIEHRVQNFLFGMFKWAGHKKWYVGPNPATDHKDSPLRELLGGARPPGGHHKALAVTDMPLLMAYLCTPPRHSDNVCTTAEAAEATGRDPATIIKAIRRGLFPGASRWAEWGTASYLIPVAELKKVFPLKQPLRHHIEIPLEWYALRLLILTGVRSSMGCELRWDYVKRKKGLIEFPPEEHKAGRKTGEQYLVIITPGVAEILDTMEAMQKRDGMYDAKGFVFVHGPTRTGIDVRTGRSVDSHTVRYHLRLILSRIPEIEDKDATVHGMRAVIATWLDENDFPHKVAKKALGHTIHQDDVDWHYFYNVKFLDQRRKAMLAWEAYCMQSPHQPVNIIPLRSLPTIRKKGKHRA